MSAEARITCYESELAPPALYDTKIFSVAVRRITARSVPASTEKLPLSSGGFPVELIVVIVLLLLLFGSFPVFPHSRNWGYYPSGGLGTILLIVVILWLLHVI
jgi:hypothetical protein